MWAPPRWSRSGPLQSRCCWLLSASAPSESRLQSRYRDRAAATRTGTSWIAFEHKTVCGGLRFHFRARVWGLVGWIFPTRGQGCGGLDGCPRTRPVLGGLGGPREDAADAAHVHQGAGLRRLRRRRRATLLRRRRLREPRWRPMDQQWKPLQPWVAYAGVGGVGWLVSSPTALGSQGVGW